MIFVTEGTNKLMKQLDDLNEQVEDLASITNSNSAKIDSMDSLVQNIGTRIEEIASVTSCAKKKH